MKILVYGSLNIDLVYSVDHIVLPSETISSATLEKSAGGKGANQAAALAKAGMEVYMAGKIGEDGRFLLDLLESYGVNTGKVAIYGGITGQALIQLDRNGQNSIILYAGGNGENKRAEIDNILGSFAPGDAVLLQNEIPHVGTIMEKAKGRGMRVFFNPSPYDEKIKKLPLEKVDVFFVNEIEAAALAADIALAANAASPVNTAKASPPLATLPAGTLLTGTPPPETPPPRTPPYLILDKLAKNFPTAEIILTAGKDGAYYGLGPKQSLKSIREKGEIIELPVADTTGAGDTFTGYYIAAREKQFSVSEALNLACKAASIAVSRKGAMQSIPFADEVFFG